MIKIRIGNEERHLSDANKQWVTQQINNRRRDGQRVCIVVTIEEPCARVTLATPECAGGGGGRRPNAAESNILRAWEHFGLDAVDVPPGRVVAFLNELERLC